MKLQKKYCKTKQTSAKTKRENDTLMSKKTNKKRFKIKIKTATTTAPNESCNNI